jgi:hypothetical protein
MNRSRGRQRQGFVCVRARVDLTDAHFDALSLSRVFLPQELIRWWPDPSKGQLEGR